MNDPKLVLVHHHSPYKWGYFHSMKLGSVLHFKDQIPSKDAFALAFDDDGYPSCPACLQSVGCAKK